MIKWVILIFITVIIEGCNTVGEVKTSVELSPQELNDKAAALWKDGQYSDPHLALRYTNKAIEKDPSYGRAYYTRGFIYYDLKKYEESIESFTEALKYDPDIHETYNGRGWVYYTVGEYEKAIDDYTSAIQIKGNYKQALNNRAVAYLKNDQKQKGCNDFRKVCALGDCSNLKHAKKTGECE